MPAKRRLDAGAVASAVDECGDDESVESEDEYDEDDDIDVEDVGCSICGKLDSTEENDIWLCDKAGCYRAYHVMYVRACCAAQLRLPYIHSLLLHPSLWC